MFWLFSQLPKRWIGCGYPRAPQLCLARFDELKAIGLEAFTRKYDPYWDIPLNENLPQPVIDLPIPAEAEQAATGRRGRGRRRDVTGQQMLNLDGEPPAGTEAGEPAPPRRGRRRRASPRAANSDAPADDGRAYNELLAYLRNQRTITSADAQQLLGLTATAVRPLLRRLVEEGHAATQGRGRATTYLVSGDNR